MAEDDSFCLSLCEDIGPTNNNSKSERKILQDKVDVTPNTIRLDALKLSKELKYKNNFKFDNAPTRVPYTTLYTFIVYQLFTLQIKNCTPLIMAPLFRK